MAILKPDEHSYIKYRGYEIDQRKRYNAKLDGWLTYGYYFGNTYYQSLTDVKLVIDEICNQQREARFWNEYDEMNYD